LGRGAFVVIFTLLAGPVHSDGGPVYVVSPTDSNYKPIPSQTLDARVAAVEVRFMLAGIPAADSRLRISVGETRDTNGHLVDEWITIEKFALGADGAQTSSGDNDELRNIAVPSELQGAVKVEGGLFAIMAASAAGNLPRGAAIPADGPCGGDLDPRTEQHLRFGAWWSPTSFSLFYDDVRFVIEVGDSLRCDIMDICRFESPQEER